MDHPLSPNPLRSTSARGAPPTYTTVGSVFSPNSAAPLQPPARRGRTLRWQNTVQSDLAGLPKALLLNLSQRHMVPRSPPTTASSLQHYAPLQQNYDRAATPTIGRDRDDEFVRLGISQGELDTGNMLSAPFKLPLRLDSPSMYEDHVDTSDDGEGSQDLLTAHAFTVKALTNLASYENPMQRAARKTLARARPALSATTNVPHAAMPALTSDSVSDLTNDRLPVSVTLRSSLSDSRALIDSDLRADFRRRPGQTSDHPQLRRQEYGRFSKFVGNSPGSGIDTSNLAKGPGAPRPLTAGPPGLRQYRPSTFEGTFKALHQSSEVPSRPSSNGFFSCSNPLPVGHGRPGSMGVSRLGSIYGRQTASLLVGSEQEKRQTAFTSGATTGCSTPRLGTRGLASKIVDTTTYEEVRPYYPEGRPANFGKIHRPSDQNWAQNHELQAGYNGYEKSMEMLEMRATALDAYFYAGTNMLGKSSDTIIKDAEQRYVNQQNDRNDFGRRLGAYVASKPAIKVVYPPLSVDDANKLPASVHAEPILNLVFASLLSYMEDNGRKGQMSGFKVPDSQHLDHSTQGQKSFWDSEEANSLKLAQ